MTVTSTLRVVAMVLVAVTVAAGLAHVLALPNKIDLPAADYLTVQQIYSGWALLGIVFIAALVTLLVVAARVRRERSSFVLTLAAAGCIALSLVVFFAFTYPANRATSNWTMLPDNWEALRRQWEYSHAANAGLYLAALVLLTCSFLVGTRAAGETPATQERRRGITTPRSSAARIASS